MVSGTFFGLIAGYFRGWLDELIMRVVDAMLALPFLVLAITFVILDLYGITLQRISLGALIIALGLLVDDAMIAIETMISRLEIGESLESAASYAWTSIAFPMLTGTLVTVAGFIPIGLNNSAAGEFTFSLFVVIAVSLVVSWIVAVLFAPLLGVTFLRPYAAHHEPKPGWLRRRFHGLLLWSMRFRWVVIAVTLALFAVSVWGMRFVARRARPRFMAQWKHTGILNAHIEETFTGHAVVKAFGRQREVEQQFRETNGELYEASFGAQFMSSLMQPVTMFMGNIQYVIVAVVGGLRVTSGAITLTS